MKRFENAKVLIVGGAGFVGSNLTKTVLEEGAKEVIVVDNLLSAEKENIPFDESRLTFIEDSITQDHVLDHLPQDLDYVFHLSTYHGNQSSIHDPLADHENNTLTSLKLFNRISGFKGIKKVVYSSAGCTVAEKTFDKAHATDEDAPVSLYLDSPYQISKIIGEFYANYYFKLYGLPVVKARFQNVYGPGEVLGAGKWRGTPATVWRNVTPTFVYKALTNQPIPVENSGIATRDFIYVTDIVEGLICCAVNGVPGGVYNLASGVETTILELAQTIISASGSSSKLEVLPKRAWDNSGKRYGSTDKAEKEIGFKCQMGFEEGIKKTVEWTRANMDRINKAISKHDTHMKGN